MAKMRQAVQEIRRAVERIDDPAVAPVAAWRLAALLHEEAEAGPRALQLGLERALGLEVGVGDEIARALHRDLKLLDLAEIAEQARAPP